MVASPEMRAIRELALAAPLALTGYALFFGGGPGDGSVFWLGTLGLVALVALLATWGIPGGGVSLVPLALLAGWMALSISWSALPDRSWDYADRTLIYLLFAALGLWFAGRTRELALGLCLLLGAVVVWALAGKVLPFVYDYGPPYVTRLRSPVGLWNQLALLGAFALPLALWRRRLDGTLLAYGWLVALLLTYSRGGLITAVLVVVAWFALTDERAESAATLIAAALPAAVAVGVAFALPGITSNGQSSHVRWRDGLVFGLVLLLGAAAIVPLRRLPARAVRGGLALLGVLVAAAFVVALVKGSGSEAVTNGGGRLGSTSSNFRLTWWKQAWDGFRDHVLGGTGAGSFHVTNLLYRRSFLDFTIEPHDIPLQFLSELGVVGLVLFVAVAVAFLRGSLHRRGHELALALVFPAFLVHSLVDVNWDFVAVSVPAFLVAGALVGTPAEKRASAFATLAAVGAGLLVFVVLLLPWLGARWSAQASTELNRAKAAKLAKRARSVNPFLVEPYWTLAFAAKDNGTALAYYDDAVRRQPRNAQTWLAAGQFALSIGCPRHAYPYLEKFSELDHYAEPDKGPDDYRRALRLVNSGTPRC
jgi:O-antigen ligase